MSLLAAEVCLQAETQECGEVSPLGNRLSSSQMRTLKSDFTKLQKRREGTLWSPDQGQLAAGIPHQESPGVSLIIFTPGTQGSGPLYPESSYHKPSSLPLQRFASVEFYRSEVQKSNLQMGRASSVALEMDPFCLLQSCSGGPRWSLAGIGIILVPTPPSPGLISPSVFTQPPSFKDTGYIKLSGPGQGLELGSFLKFKGQENQKSALPKVIISA